MLCLNVPRGPPANSQIHEQAKIPSPAIPRRPVPFLSAGACTRRRSRSAPSNPSLPLAPRPVSQPATIKIHPMATEEPTPRRYRRLKRASDVSAVPVAVAPSSSKRMRMSKEHNCYEEEDMISSLPDDILALILDKLDPCTTIITTILSKRWQNLPRRSMTCYDFAVDDILPPCYLRVKRLWMEAKATFAAEKDALKLASKGPMDQRLADIYSMTDHNDRWIRRISALEAILQRYKCWAMRSYVKRVNAFLLPPDGVHWTIQKLRLQTFGRGWNVFRDGLPP